MRSKRNCVVSSRTVMLKIDDSFFSLTGRGGVAQVVPCGTRERRGEKKAVSSHDTCLCNDCSRTSVAPCPVECLDSLKFLKCAATHTR